MRVAAPRRRCIRRIEIAAGVTPGIRLACPSETGRTKLQLLDHLARQSRQRVRHVGRDPQPPRPRCLRRFALLPLDVAGVAKLADDAIRLFVAQRAKRVRDLREHVFAASVKRSMSKSARCISRAIVDFSFSVTFAAASQASVSRSGVTRRFRRIPRPLHPRDARVDAALALVVEDAEALGDRREALVDGVAAEEEAVLRARGEHPVRLLGA